VDDARAMTDKPVDTTDADALAWIERIARGDEDAFVALYRRYQPDVYRFAFAMAKSSALAQDVAQDVFLRVLKDTSGFDSEKGSVRAWLLGCARHAVIDRLRNESRWSEEMPEEGSQPCEGEEQVSRQQRSSKLHAAIVGLPFEYREAIVLCELEELSYAETAALLECPVGTIRSRLHRAKALLAIRLGELDNVPAGVAAAKAPPAAGPLLAASEVCS
jgi:RNA polymerase sigma-70 factor (ECF subfamily)